MAVSSTQLLVLLSAVSIIFLLISIYHIGGANCNSIASVDLIPGKPVQRHETRDTIPALLSQRKILQSSPSIGVVSAAAEAAAAAAETTPPSSLKSTHQSSPVRTSFESNYYIISKIAKHIQQRDDVHYQGRMSSDRNYSYAQKQLGDDTPNGGNIKYLSRYGQFHDGGDTIENDGYRISWKGFYEKGKREPMVPLVAWSREKEDMFMLKRKDSKIVTAQDMALSMKNILEGHLNQSTSSEYYNHNKQNSPSSSSSLSSLSPPTMAATPIRAIRYVLGHRLCFLANQVGGSHLSSLPVPVLFTTRFDENYGFFSSDIPGRTCTKHHYNASTRSCFDLSSVAAMLEGCKSSVEDFTREVLDHPKVLLIITTQHQSFEHDKILSVPIGIRPHIANEVVNVLAMMQMNFTHSLKKKLLVVNFNTRYYRFKLAQHYKDVFGEVNGYDKSAGMNANSSSDSSSDSSSSSSSGGSRTPAAADVGATRRSYLLSMAQSKFVICPSGLGADTYRLWEAIAMGSFPVVESNPGLDKLYAYLPVLVVHDLFTVTEDLLNEAYDCFVAHADDWKFEILTQAYWDLLILQAMETVSIAHVRQNHPLRNPYCDFYEKSKTYLSK